MPLHITGYSIAKLFLLQTSITTPLFCNYNENVVL